MYGCKVAFVRNHKFSFIGFIIQVIESLNVLMRYKKFYWMPFYHVSFYDEELGRWFDANDGVVSALTDKQFCKRYLTIEEFEFDCEIDHTTREWLLSQVGKKYAYHAIYTIYRKFKRSWFGIDEPFFEDGDTKFICSELILKALDQLGFMIPRESIEITSIEETYQIVRNL